jgi:hypothetical protein
LLKDVSARTVPGPSCLKKSFLTFDDGAQALGIPRSLQFDRPVETVAARFLRGKANLGGVQRQVLVEQAFIDGAWLDVLQGNKDLSGLDRVAFSDAKFGDDAALKVLNGSPAPIGAYDTRRDSALGQGRCCPPDPEAGDEDRYHRQAKPDWAPDPPSQQSRIGSRSQSDNFARLPLGCAVLQILERRVPSGCRHCLPR